MTNNNIKTSNKKLALSILIAGLLLPVLATAETQAVKLNNAKDRITDQAISADHASYKNTQNRIAALNNNGIAVRDYHLSKAQCWLDVSFHEYSRNDRSSFTQDALNQAVKIIEALEAKQTPSNETVLVNNATKLRPDLWQIANYLKQQDANICKAQKVACAEVELVHAGNEHNQQGWRHAKPYIQIAEDLIGEAQSAGGLCRAPAPIPGAVREPEIIPAPIPAPQTQFEPIELNAQSLFKFDKSRQADMLPEGKATLDDLVSRLKQTYVQISSIRITGHADSLGQPAYNMRLSEKRASTVKEYLQNQGVTGVIEAFSKGETEPVTQCAADNKKSTIACLQPNRRVTVEVKGQKRQ